MVESNFVDYLPPGWTMKERIRDNGKRDKFYHAPKNGPKFNSKVEVYRYLAAQRISHYKRKRKKKRGLKQPWKIISVEKVKEDNLPPGWIGEIRVSKKNQTIRRDPYYTNPGTETSFRSLKAIYRHLRIKERVSTSQNSDCDSYISDDGQSVASRTRRQIHFGQSSAMNVLVKNHQRHNSSSQPLFGSEHDSEQKDEKSFKDGLPRIKSGQAQSGHSKSKIKKLSDLPRRSKRLAGIEVDPVGLKPKTRTRRDSALQSGKGNAGSDEIKQETKCNTEHPKRAESSNSDTAKYLSDNSVGSERQIVRLETEFGSDEKRMDDEKLGAPLGLPLGELLSDPCIAFAIKILTGLTFDGCKEALPGTSSSNRSSINLASDTSYNAAPEDNAITTQRGQIDAACTEFSFGGASWKDPCIEFAIKTLTDSVQLEYCPNAEQTRGRAETNSSSVSFDNRCQTDLSS